MAAQASTALALPGAIVSMAPAPAAGVAKLEPRLVAILTNAKVPVAMMERAAHQAGQVASWATVAAYSAVGASWAAAD